MKKIIHKCIRCERIIGVNVIPHSNEKDEVMSELECIKCYNSFNWGKN